VVAVDDPPADLDVTLRRLTGEQRQ
jgi:hypothetical protein